MKKKSVVVRTATAALRILWEEAFFAGWRKKAEVDKKLALRGNHFSVAELGMALKRAPHLTRRGKRGSFAYIQKHPFVAEQTTLGPTRNSVNNQAARKRKSKA